MFGGLTAFLATTAGKVAVTGAVAAASVGGMHAADVVDVPVLPSNDPPPIEDVDEDADLDDAEVTDGENGEELPEEAVAGQETAEGKRAAAEAYTQAIRDWTACVSTNAQAQGDEETREDGAFDPREGCDDRPDPHAFGLTDVPDQASEEGEENSDAGKANRDRRGRDGAAEGDESEIETESEDEEIEDEEVEDEEEEIDDESDDSNGGPPSDVPGRP